MVSGFETISMSSSVCKLKKGDASGTTLLDTEIVTKILFAIFGNNLVMLDL